MTKQPNPSHVCFNNVLIRFDSHDIQKSLRLGRGTSFGASRGFKFSSPERDEILSFLYERGFVQFQEINIFLDTSDVEQISVCRGLDHQVQFEEIRIFLDASVVEQMSVCRELDTKSNLTRQGSFLVLRLLRR